MVDWLCNQNFLTVKLKSQFVKEQQAKGYWVI